MQRKDTTQENKIPKLELEEFTFTPPGPMGLSLQNYLQNQDDNDQNIPLEKNENPIHKFLENLQSDLLFEYPIKNRHNAVQNKEIDTLKQNSVHEENNGAAKQIISEDSSFEKENLDSTPKEESPSEPEYVEPIPPGIPVKIIIMNQVNKPWSPPHLTKNIKNR